MRRILENWLKICNCSPQKTWKRFIKFNFLNVIYSLNKKNLWIAKVVNYKSWKGYSVADITETTLNLSEVWLDFIKDEGSIEAVIGKLQALRKYGKFGKTSLWKWITSMKGPRNNSQWSKNFRNLPSSNWPISKWPIFRSDLRFRIVCNPLLMDTRKVGSMRIRFKLWYLIY